MVSYNSIISLRKQIKKHVPEQIIELHKRTTLQGQVPQPNDANEEVLSKVADQEERFPSKPKIPFEQLPKAELDRWMVAAMRELAQLGLPKIGPNATRTRAQALYEQSVKSYEELRSELLASYRRDLRAGENPLSRLAARRLPDDGDPNKKK